MIEKVNIIWYNVFVKSFEFSFLSDKIIKNKIIFLKEIY